jgi:hypothetical protein
MERKYADGKNIVFYYGSTEHLLVNLVCYIKEAYAKGNRILVFLEDNIFEKLNDICHQLIADNFYLEHINFPELLMNDDFSQNEIVYEKYIDNIEKIEEKQYEGIQIIQQVSETVKTISKNTYINRMNNINDIIKKDYIDILNVYDFDDYINKGIFIDEEIIKNARIKHDFTLTNFQIVETESLIKNNELGLHS